MNKTPDLKTWFTSGDSLALVVQPGELFSLLKHSYPVPPGFAALALRRDGAAQIFSAASDIPDDEWTEILFVRSTPIDGTVLVSKAVAKDRYLCEAEVQVRLRVLPEPGELGAFRDRVLGSKRKLDIAGLTRFLQAEVEEAIRSFVGQHAAAELVDATDADDCGRALAEALRGPCFSSGLSLESDPVVKFTSSTYEQTRLAEEQVTRRLHEHRAQAELRDALAAAQRERLADLEGLLGRLKTLADESPEVALPELMRAFDETQRSHLYEALFASRARQRVTRWITVVAGSEVLFFDPRDPAEPARRIALEGDAGPLRSVQFSSANEAATLLVGAARGVYVLPAEGAAQQQTLLFEAPEGVRGGVNAVTQRGVDLVATHSERGIIHWRTNLVEEPALLLAEQTARAKAVRGAQFAAGRWWCSIDTSIVSLPADNLNGLATRLEAPDVVTALHVCASGIYAGTVAGDILFWEHASGATAQRLHGGSRRAAESIATVEAGGVTRLFYTDTSLAVFARVPGDTFTCRYEAGGQTLRRAAAAADLIVATNDPRDRVIVWDAGQPAKPRHIIPIARLTGRSVQDVCLVPLTEQT